MIEFKELKKVKEEYENKLFSYKGVHSIGIGYKRVAGRDNSELAILVYVDNPQMVKELKQANIVPANILIDIICVPKLSYDILFVHNIELINSDQGRYRPLIGGIQIYLAEKNSAWIGSVGTFVKSNNESDQNLYLLSNLHVLESIGLAVLQPLYGTKNIIAVTSMVDDFQDTDAALAIANDLTEIAVNTIEGVGNINEIQTLTDADLNKRVIKRGRTTMLTEGTIEATNVTIQLGDGTIRTDCVIVRADDGKLFSDSGDSGSPVILKDENKLVGLHFAGDKTLGGISVFCKIDNVFRNLSVKLPD
jgi:hypothetical protein